MGIIPSCINGGPRHVAVKVGFAVGPPDWAALAQRDLCDLDISVGARFGRAIAGASCHAHRASRPHQIRYQRVAPVGRKVGIGGTP